MKAIFLGLGVGVAFYVIIITVVSGLAPWQSLIREKFATAVAFQRAFHSDLIVRLILFAALLPISIVIAIVDPRWLSIFFLSILIALVGWFRGSARKYFPVQACFFAPLWVFERTLSTYVARGGET